ncbi:MAG TPA: helix-turn-helix transcriptional regulator [Clostridiales bacterium]|nr:helix-turn-helix transcriptional regulator [Clostridiales bacterium]
MDTKLFYKQELHKILEIDNVISLFYSDLNQKFDSKGESHDFWELVYIDRGKIEIDTEEKNFTLEKNCIYFHKPNEYHRHKTISGNIPSMCVVSFKCDSPLLGALADKIIVLPEYCQNILSQVLKYGSIIFTSIVDTKERLYLVKNEKYPFFLEQMLINYLEIFLLELVNINTMTYSDISDDKKSVEQSHANPSNELVLSAKVYLLNNLFTNIRIPDICEALNCSKTLLHVTFKRQTGLTIIQYLTSLRIEKAKELIRTSNLNITQIADQLRFCNINYFSNSFKKYTGMYPSEYTKSIKSKDCIRYLYSERGSQIEE